VVELKENQAEAKMPQPDLYQNDVLRDAKAPHLRAPHLRKRRASVPHARVAVLLLPSERPIGTASTIIPPVLWAEIHERYASGKSLRELARDYGVSYEAIRSIVQRSIQEVAQALLSAGLVRY
jgi:DNA-directed RNA polymerase specialized sigma24 family protein